MSTSTLEYQTPPCAIYLDASAAVKLVDKELHSDRLLTYFRPRSGFVMTPFCFYETLTTLKSKWRGRRKSNGEPVRITKTAYKDACFFLFDHIQSGKIVLQSDLNLSIEVTTQIENLVQKHDLDVSDALQLLTIKLGRYKSFGAESKTLLISDDKDLVKAASKEGLRVWFLRNSETPP